MKNTGTLQVNAEGDRAVVMTRVFDAPRQMVFDAFSKPELLKRWFGPRGWSLDVCEIDLRIGGKWRFVSSRPNGKAVGQLGVYREIVPGKRLVNTEAWEDWDAGETLVTTELNGIDGKTEFKSTILFPSQEVRDTVLKSGLEHGAGEGYDRLAKVLEEHAEAR